MVAGTRRLLLLNLPSRRQLVDGLERRLGNRTRLALAALHNPPYQTVREVAEDAIAASLDDVVRANGGPARGPEASRCWPMRLVGRSGVQLRKRWTPSGALS